MENALLSISNLSKRFSGVLALDNIGFDLYPGEVHALVGENGAGKSTLMKTIAGVHQPDTGQIVVDGRHQKFTSTRDSQSAGISMIYQELNLVNSLSIAANMFLSRELTAGPFLNESRMNEAAREALTRIGINLNPQSLVGNLSMAQKQLVEIAKAVSMQSKIIIMDEPTTSLTDIEKKLLFDTVAILKAQSVGIIYISHDLDDVFLIADRITVIRDGATVASSIASETSKAQVIYHMVGRELNQIYDFQSNIKQDVLFEVNGLSKKDMLDNISFTVKAGEIVGLSGLVGSGRTELAYHLYGLMKPDSGTIKLEGKEISISSPSKAIEKGISLVPEDRKEMGLFLEMSIRDNATMSSLDNYISFGLINSKTERDKVQKYINDFRIKTTDPEKKVINLSGGNQQKVVLARSTSTLPKLLILDEPTRGVDVGAKSEIYKLMYKLASEGVGILMISSELNEVLGVSDRILVMRNGTIAGEISREEATSELVMQYATGQR
ncbi:sugar ABC transporter ATP-binding protein [Bacillus sp. V3-13]|uniref:sugar ABC transporter ATP-binding protein n=1 Tax=Bacillus sp. V3-13 TaxID=2053728 RepID=UPI0015E118CB|nr:sugar ABC transporter ATP-binding protein [Bacillus sp. V3-13]